MLGRNGAKLDKDISLSLSVGALVDVAGIVVGALPAARLTPSDAAVRASIADSGSLGHRERFHGPLWLNWPTVPPVRLNTRKSLYALFPPRGNTLNQDTPLAGLDHHTLVARVHAADRVSRQEGTQVLPVFAKPA